MAHSSAHGEPRVEAAFRTLAFLAFAASLVAGCGRAASTGASGPEAQRAAISLETVPTPPAYISGGDALLRISAATEAELGGLRVTLNGRDVTSSFRPSPPDRLGRPGAALLGLLTGLRDGDNEIVARARGGTARLTVTNYPITGPIFSGEHLEPYFCLHEQTPGTDGEPRRFAIGNGEFISGPALDRHCSYPTRVDYVYRNGSEFEPLADPTSLPDDVERIQLAGGITVPYVVRLETGTINRAIYQTAILVDPSNPNPDPWNPPAGWNGRLVYTFGGGCEAGFFQGTSTGGVLNNTLLSRGYAVASSTLNVNAQGGCNDPLSAETTMMVKERFAEAYGPPVHTIGWGGSGGAMQQLLIANAYPGILDGILPTLTFPDAVTYFIDTEECRLPLRRYLNGRELDEETKRVIGGWALWRTCDVSLARRTNRIGPDDCPANIPPEARYDARTNPGGVRCSIYDAMRSVFGTAYYDEIQPRPTREFGRSPHSTVGVQYGLLALNQGLISKELFLDLNENVGGWDIDFQPRPERADAPDEAVIAAYETGRIVTGKGGLAITPIIEERAYRDDTGDFHTSYYSFVLQARLMRDNGHADNHVLQRRGSSPSLAASNLELMDAWLTRIALDTSDAPQAVKVVRNRPEELADACWDEDGNRIVEAQIFDRGRIFNNDLGRCNSLYPPHAGPRVVAGGPLTNDVLKCQLKPLDRRDYNVQFTDGEWLRLQRIFPRGVCDWSKPGVGQTVATRTWLSFGPSPVNRYRPPGTNR